jgi:predicted transcriptional regulator
MASRYCPKCERLARELANEKMATELATNTYEEDHRNALGWQKRALKAEGELAEARKEWERFALAVGLADGDQGRYVCATVDEAINEIKRAQSEHLADIDELAKAREDTARLDWLEKKCTGASDSERYLPFRIYWKQVGIRAAIDEAKS